MLPADPSEASEDVRRELFVSTQSEEARATAATREDKQRDKDRARTTSRTTTREEEVESKVSQERIGEGSRIRETGAAAANASGTGASNGRLPQRRLQHETKESDAGE